MDRMQCTCTQVVRATLRREWAGKSIGGKHQADHQHFPFFPLEAGRFPRNTSDSLQLHIQWTGVLDWSTGVESLEWSTGGHNEK